MLARDAKGRFCKKECMQTKKTQKRDAKGRFMKASKCCDKKDDIALKEADMVLKEAVLDVLKKCREQLKELKEVPAFGLGAQCDKEALKSVLRDMVSRADAGFDETTTAPAFDVLKCNTKTAGIETEVALEVKEAILDLAKYIADLLELDKGDVISIKVSVNGEEIT
jgi:hypothetical protein